MEHGNTNSPEGQPIGATQKKISEMAALLIRDIDAREARDGRFSASRKEVQIILGKGKTHVIKLEADGVLRSYLDGKHRRISMQSVYEYLRDLAKASYPVGAPAAKVRSPLSQFKKKRREPTQAELNALARGRERMSREAAERRRRREEASAS
jgi:hypothetical protein